jgi:hypothetical protein
MLYENVKNCDNFKIISKTYRKNEIRERLYFLLKKTVYLI